MLLLWTTFTAGLIQPHTTLSHKGQNLCTQLYSFILENNDRSLHCPVQWVYCSTTPIQWHVYHVQCMFTHCDEMYWFLRFTSFHFKSHLLQPSLSVMKQGQNLFIKPHPSISLPYWRGINSLNFESKHINSVAKSASQKTVQTNL